MDEAESSTPESSKLSLTQSISYFRVAAVATLVCGLGSAIMGALTLRDADAGRVLVGMGLTQIALGLVILTLSVACFQFVARLRAQQRRHKHHG
jgi:hypothetical protein